LDNVVHPAETGDVSVVGSYPVSTGLIDLADVRAALEKALPNQLFATRGRVVEVHRVRRSCYFILADWDERLPCALLRRYAAGIGFWMRVGQIVEVTGYAEQFCGQWQLFVTQASLIKQLVPLCEVGASLETALPDRLFTTRGKVVMSSFRDTIYNLLFLSFST
jgi:hypothetical protein